MTKLDLLTGLPRLKEPDLFFRVKETSVELVRRLPDGDWYIDGSPYDNPDRYNRVQYESRETETRTRDTSYDKKRWWGTERVRGTKREPYARNIGRTEVVASAVGKKIGTRKMVADSFGGFPRYEEVDVYETVTKKGVIALAEQALQNYKDEQKSKRLLGDYPPKRLI